MAKFFIDRPIFAAVISVIITLAGGIAVGILPVAQYPEITPPTVQVTCNYPGASSKVVAETVAAPIEQQVIGVENVLYMSSQMHERRRLQPDRHIRGRHQPRHGPGARAEPRQPGPALAAAAKSRRPASASRRSRRTSCSSSICISPKGSYDQLYLSNYATIQIRDELAQIKGVGDVTYLGQLDYSMRAWLDPERMAARDLSASDVANALREQNVQVAAGRSAARPCRRAGLSIHAQHARTADRSRAVRQHRRQDGRRRAAHAHARPRHRRSEGRARANVRRHSAGAKIEDTSCSLDGQPSIGLGIFQQPGSNALETAECDPQTDGRAEARLSAGPGLRDRL